MTKKTKKAKSFEEVLRAAKKNPLKPSTVRGQRGRSLRTEPDAIACGREGILYQCQAQPHSDAALGYWVGWLCGSCGQQEFAYPRLGQTCGRCGARVVHLAYHNSTAGTQYVPSQEPPKVPPFTEDSIRRSDLPRDVFQLLHDLAYDHEGRDRWQYRSRAQEALMQPGEVRLKIAIDEKGLERIIREIATKEQKRTIFIQQGEPPARRKGRR